MELARVSSTGLASPEVRERSSDRLSRAGIILGDTPWCKGGKASSLMLGMLGGVGVTEKVPIGGDLFVCDVGMAGKPSPVLRTLAGVGDPLQGNSSAPLIGGSCSVL
jgi:hypothetical protein